MHYMKKYMPIYKQPYVYAFTDLDTSSSFRSSDGNSSLLNKGGSTSSVPQAITELSGYGSVVWSDSLSEWFLDRAGLQ